MAKLHVRGTLEQCVTALAEDLMEADRQREGTMRLYDENKNLIYEGFSIDEAADAVAESFGVIHNTKRIQSMAGTTSSVVEQVEDFLKDEYSGYDWILKNAEHIEEGSYKGWYKTEFLYSPVIRQRTKPRQGIGFESVFYIACIDEDEDLQVREVFQ